MKMKMGRSEMIVDCNELNYKNYGKCVCIDNHTIKLIATLDVGPRIIYFGLSNGENVLFEDIQRNFAEDTGKYGTWYAYGGHRIWRAPEVMPETYYPDNENVEYTFNNNVLELTQRQTPFGKKFSIVCTFNDDNTVNVENRITNCLDKPQKFAPWSVTGLAPGGIEIIPMCNDNTGFLPNRTIALWPYSDIYDSRFKICNNIAFLKHDPSSERAFKAGFNITSGEVRYIIGNQTFTKHFDKYDQTLNYPDFMCNFETYTNKYFLECELIGDEREYQPFETAVISEKWSVNQTCNDDLDKIDIFTNEGSTYNV